MIKLSVSFDKPYKPFGQKVLAALVKGVEQHLPARTEDAVHINIKITSEKKLRQLNKKYGGVDRTTDVLSFNYTEGGNGPIKDKQGDIVVSYEHVQKQSKEAKTSESTELALLALHGMLHVFGFDHQTAAQIANLEVLQKEIMESAGLKYRKFDWQPGHF